MKKYNFLIAALMFSIMLSVTSCNDDEPDQIITETNISLLNMEFDRLPALGDDYTYEGWIIVDGVPITAGIFNVDESGNLDRDFIELNTDDLTKATAYALTIEPVPDNDAAPSKVHILGGNFEGNTSELTTDHPLAIGTDFTDAGGSYLLGTPTDGSLDSDETSGIWWEDLSTGLPMASLDLPVLPEGWEYEGWVVIDGQALTTGKFLGVEEPDFAAPYSGSSAGPPYPGEDFLENAPSGLSFPVDLSGKLTVISVEPSPDNSPAPFSLKPLVHTIPNNAAFHTGYQMQNDAINSNPVGTISRDL